MYKSALLLFFFTLTFFFLAPATQAQQTPEERFKTVQLLSSQENYHQAINELKLLILEYPENLDYQIQLGRIYAWAEKYEDSKSTLLPIVEEHPENEAAFSALLNTLLWSENYTKAIKYAGTGIQRFPDKKFDYQQIQLQAYKNSGSIKKALALVDSLRRDNPHNSDLEETETNLLNKLRNKIILSYSNSFFPSDNFDPWNLGSISYSRDWKNIPTEFRLSYANIFNRNDVQFDINLYPILSNSSYLFLNLGFAPNHSIFPSYRAGLEYFYGFQNGINLSAGARLLGFPNETIPILTAHVDKTIDHYNVQYRPFLVLKNNNSFTTHTLALRKNWPIKEAFLQLDLQYGTAPYFLFFADDFERVSSKRIGFQSQIKATRNWFIKFSLMYEYEEYSPGNFRNRLNSQIIFVNRF